MLAAAVVTIHFLFVLFVLFGSLLALRWRRVIPFHLAAALWGVWIEASGWICPLTPLENALRAREGRAPYVGDFVEHYVGGILYPAGLTRRAQIVLALVVIGVNAVGYSAILLARRSRRSSS